MKETIEKIKNLVGSEYLHFDTPVTVRLTPHSWPVNIWAICVSPANELYAMDAEQNWYKVEEKDGQVVPSLRQRVNLIHKLFKAVA